MKVFVRLVNITTNLILHILIILPVSISSDIEPLQIYRGENTTCGTWTGTRRKREDVFIEVLLTDKRVAIPMSWVKQRKERNLLFLLLLHTNFIKEYILSMAVCFKMGWNTVTSWHVSIDYISSDRAHRLYSSSFVVSQLTGTYTFGLFIHTAELLNLIISTKLWIFSSI